MNWINISEIDNQKEIEGEGILVWQHNLSDKTSSRFQRGIYFKGDEKTSSFIKIYPDQGSRGYFKQDNGYKNYDLEGDMCQITHFAIISPPKN